MYDNTFPEICYDKPAPQFTSPYIRYRNEQARRLFERLRQNDFQEGRAFEEIWSLRPRFPLAACFNVHTLCNSRCIMCSYKDDAHPGGVEFMDFSAYAERLEDFYASGGRILTFNNYSDIFAHPQGMDYVDHFLANYLDKVQVYFVTNAIALTRDKVDRILATGFRGIVYVSCHGFSAETYAAVTGRNAFESVLENIVYLVRNHPLKRNVVVQFGTDFSGAEEIGKAKDFWGELGVSLNIFTTHTFAGNSSHKATVKRQRPLIGCRGWGIDAGLPFYQMPIQHDLKVSLCCMDLRGRIETGDLSRQSIVEAWNSTASQEAIRQIYCGKEGQINRFCRNCNAAMFESKKGDAAN